jgi:hypothetical protein
MLFLNIEHWGCFFIVLLIVRVVFSEKSRKLLSFAFSSQALVLSESNVTAPTGHYSG